MKKLVDDNNDNYDKDEVEDPDKLIPIASIELLTQWITEGQREISSKSIYRSNTTYPSLAICYLQLHAHVLEYPERMEEFLARENELDKIFGGNPIYKKYELDPAEASARWNNILILWRDIGPGWIDTRGEYRYRPGMIPDNIEFKNWTDE